MFDVGEAGQGIVHVIGPELGIVLPGLTVICGDSHTCTNGGLGALAFGVGSSESTHALATQTLRLQKPRRMRIRCDGILAPGVTAKDLALHIIGRLGAATGTGYAIEYAGSAVDALDVEARLTLCNLTVELGARCGLVAPDERTIDYVRGRPYAPQGAAFDAAVAYWRTLRTDDDAVFDRDEVVDASDVAPTITWGTSPEHAIAIDARVPDPAHVDSAKRESLRRRARLHGTRAGRADRRHARRLGVRRLVRQLAAVGPAGCSCGGRRPPSRPEGDGVGRARLGERQAGRGSRGLARSVHRRRLRVA